MGKSIKMSSFSVLLNACNQLMSRYRFFAPTIEDEVENYLPLEQMNEEQVQAIEALAFGTKPPTGSIKSFFFPDSETYIRFTKKGNDVEIAPYESLPAQIILAAKPCDIRSVELIDKVFLAEPVDTMYQERRKKTIIIATNCAEMGANCTCAGFGVSPSAPIGDLVMTRDEEGAIHLLTNSSKGERLIQELVELDEGLVISHSAAAACKPAERLSPEWIQTRMDELFESPLWDELALTCLGCGICTYYCPTCHCYDIRDFSRKDQGVRYRTWDSCMFANFTNMAGGHNPRPTKKDRIRNRFFHKLNYFVKKQGELACVGCGRCAELCPVGISISGVLKKIGGELHDS